MRRRNAVAALLCALPFGASAQAPSAQAFLEGIYQPYRKNDFKGQPYWEAGRFFAPDLTRAMERDLAESKRGGEPPLLNGDPFLDAQDWQISSLSISSSTAKSKAAGEVALVNFDEPRAFAIALVQTPAGWRISDIVSTSGSLRGLYKLP